VLPGACVCVWGEVLDARPPRAPAPPARPHAAAAATPAGGEAPQGLLKPSAAAQPSTSAAAAAQPSSSAPAPAAPQQAPAAAAGGGPDREAQLARLMHLGFDKATCAAALDAANGSEEMAASILFGDMMM
jgi:hypothetical protein